MKMLRDAFIIMILTIFFGSIRSHAAWIQDGVPLTRQWGNDDFGVIAADGQSGVYVAYRACLMGVSCIMAQRADSLGANQWGEDGIVVAEPAPPAAQSPAQALNLHLVVEEPVVDLPENLLQ